MFSKKITHAYFKNLEKGFFSYSGKLDFSSFHDIEINIKGQSIASLEFASNEVQYIEENLEDFLNQAASNAFSSYEIMKDVVDSGEYDLVADGGTLPVIETSKEVWKHFELTDILIDPKAENQIRLGFTCPWDIEHDFGIYISNRIYQFSGISV